MGEKEQPSSSKDTSKAAGAFINKLGEKIPSGKLEQRRGVRCLWQDLSMVRNVAGTQIMATLNCICA